MRKRDLALKKWTEDYESRLQALEKKKRGNLKKLSRKYELSNQRDWERLSHISNSKIKKKLADLKKKIQQKSRLPRTLNLAIRRQLQRRYPPPRHPSSWRRGLVVLGVVVFFLLAELPGLTEEIRTRIFDHTLITLTSVGRIFRWLKGTLLALTPLVGIFLLSKDHNKLLEIQNSRHATNLTEFQKLEDRVCEGNNLALKRCALQQLCPYLRGEEDENLHLRAYKLLRSLLNQLKGTSPNGVPEAIRRITLSNKMHLDEVISLRRITKEEWYAALDTNQFKSILPKPQEATATPAIAPPADQLHSCLCQIAQEELHSCLRQIAQEEWYALLLNHNYSMSNLVLEGVDFPTPLYLPDRILEHLHAPHASLSHSVLCQANLREANLREANLREANLSGANLREADLRWADLRGADLSGANLSEADLIMALLNAYHPDFAANLIGSDLTGAYLIGSDLSGSDLSGAILTKAKLNGADFSGADLTGTTVTPEQWAQALSWEGCSPPPTIKA